MSFAQGEVGFTEFEGDFIQDSRVPFFYSVVPSSLSVERLDEEKYKAVFGANGTSAPRPMKWTNLPKEFRTSAGDLIKIDYEGCEAQEEGGPICNGAYLTYKDRRFKLNVSSGTSVPFAERWDNQLWLCLGSKGELEWYGAGFQVYDVV